jgi:hypothetical protein
VYLVGSVDDQRAMQSLVVLKTRALKLVFDTDHNTEVAHVLYPKYRMMLREIHMTQP